MLCIFKRREICFGRKKGKKNYSNYSRWLGVTYGTLTCDTTKDKLGREIKVIPT